MGNYCLGFWCPCILFGQNVEDGELINEDGCNSAGCAIGWLALTPIFNWLLGGTKRTAMRIKYGIDGNGCDDACTHFWCTSCALAQERREIDKMQRTATLETSTGVRVTVRTPTSRATASTSSASRPRAHATEGRRGQRRQLLEAPDTGSSRRPAVRVGAGVTDADRYVNQGFGDYVAT